MSKYNFKLTSQRVEILNYLNQTNTHPTAKQIYKVVKTKLTRISKATVYNNLNFLVEENVIKKVNVKGILRFESNNGPHHHLICKQCAKIMDFESELLSNYARELVQEQSDFQIEGLTMNFMGYCKECQKT